MYKKRRNYHKSRRASLCGGLRKGFMKKNFELLRFPRIANMQGKANTKFGVVLSPLQTACFMHYHCLLREYSDITDAAH